MHTIEKLKDPNLSEEEEDAIIGAFVRQYENDKLRERWSRELARQHGVTRPASARPRSTSIRKLVFGALALAASLLLLFTFLPALGQQSGPDLLAVYVAQVELESSRSTQLTGIAGLRQEMTDAFRDQRYAEALSIGERILELPAATTEDVLRLGKVALQAGRFADAERHLRKALEETSVFTAEARYHLGLALLQQDKTEAGLATLRALQPSDGVTLYERARELLTKKW